MVTYAKCKDCSNPIYKKYSVRCSECISKGHKHTCVICNSEFYNNDAKGKFCFTCKEKVEYECSCGCGKTLQKSKVEVYLSAQKKPYALGHAIKGKTYFEIHGTDRPPCGYQPGKANVAKRPEIRKKISANVSGQYERGEKVTTPRVRREKLTYNGVLYRSNFELKVVKFFNENSIDFEYEKKVRLIASEDNYFNKVVDFVVNDIYIEATGLFMDPGGVTFMKKISLLRDSLDSSKKIIALTQTKQSYNTLKDNPSFPKGVNLIEFKVFCKNFKEILQIQYIKDMKERQ